MKSKKSIKAIEIVSEKQNSDNNNMLIWGYSIKWFIVLIWSIPWALILGYALGFSSLFWGIMEYYSVVLLVFVLTNKDYGFLPLTYILTSAYFLYILPEKWITSTYFGFNKTISWIVINSIFAIFVFFNKSLKAYKKYNKRPPITESDTPFLKNVVKKNIICTIILAIVSTILLIPAYIFSLPQKESKNYDVTFMNKELEKAIRSELGIDDNKSIKCSDLDSVVAISIKDSCNINLGKSYEYSSETWTTDDIILNFENIIRFDGTDYSLKKPLTNIKDLKHFRNLKYLNIQGDDNLIIYNLDDIRCLKKLETLTLKSSIYDNSAETNIKALSYLTSLRCLVIDASKLDNISFISKLTKLNTLRVTNNSKLKSIKPVMSLDSIEYLSFSGCSVSDIKPITRLKGLKYLSLNNNYISDISNISQLTNLIYLDLRNNKISDISSLSSLNQLKYAALLENPDITDITPVGSITGLKYLWIEKSSNYDLSSLSTNTELEIYTGQ